MSSLASLEKPVRRGGVSRWFFFGSDDDSKSFYAESSQGKRIRCRDRADMRRLYKRMLGYGFYPCDV